jgi:hexokinase
MNIKTPWDLTLDASSDAPGFQPFEYMTAGRYLGEIVRLVFLDVVKRELRTNIPASLGMRNALPTRFLSEVVARLDLEHIKEELQKRHPYTSSSIPYWTTTRVDLLRRIAQAVQQRSSALIAAACIGLLHCVHDICIDDQATSNGIGLRKDSDIEELVIAYAGGTISQYPRWLETCQHWINTLVRAGSKANESKRVVLREALNGGIIGAGVLAGMTNGID